MNMFSGHQNITKQQLIDSLQAVIMTHGHADHFFGLSTWLGGRTNVPIYAQASFITEITTRDQQILGALAARTIYMTGWILPKGTSDWHLSTGLGPYLGYDGSFPVIVLPNNLFDDNNIQIPIQNLDEIKKHDVTKGKIIASSFNFQTRHDINHVFSILLEIKFLDEVKSIPMAKRYRNNKFVKWDKYLDLFSLRHKIVHDVSAKVNFSSTEINDISRATELFTYLSSVTVFVQLYKKYPTVLKKDLPGIYQFTEDLYGE